MSPVILAPRLNNLLGTMALRCVPWIALACCRAGALAGPLAVHLGVEFTLAPGQGAETADLGTPTARVRFVRVIEDGRSRTRSIARSLVTTRFSYGCMLQPRASATTTSSPGSPTWSGSVHIAACFDPGATYRVWPFRVAWRLSGRR